MHRGLAAAVLFIALCPSARGDEIVLRSGRTLAGSIVKEDDGRVTIQIHGGEISIARVDIQEIRRGPAPADAPPPAQKPAGAAASAPQSVPTKAPDAKTSPRALLNEMGSIVLAAWPTEGPSVATESTIAPFRVVGADGSSTLTFTRPKAPEGVAALYFSTRTTDGRTTVKVDGVDRWYWNRLYWNDDEDMWTQIHPDERRFQRDADLAGRVTDACCRDDKARGAAYGDARTIARMLQNDRSATTAKERAKLHEDCALAAGSKDAGEILAQVLECHVDVMTAKNPAEKVAAAMKRREALRRLVDAVGG